MSSGEEDSHYNSSNSNEAEQSDGGEIVNSDETPVGRLQKDYTILKGEAINQRQNDDISTVSNFLSISRGAACSLLRHYDWSIDIVYDQWFADENRVRESVGLLPKQSTSNSSNFKLSCNICFDDFSNPKSMISTSCGVHLFCTDCWKTYIHVSINDGPGCLTLRCPEPSCNAVVDLDLIDSIASSEDKEKYQKYLERSYVEDSRKRKWCSGPGCDYVVQYDAGGCDESYDVTCDCSNKFCWNCVEESHRPVDCETVKEWNKKNVSEAENTTWILAYTKPCPKCKHPIEKSQGCNHMTCRKPCGFQFCWLCLDPWKGHSNCNKYPGGDTIIDKTNREHARKYLEKYAHYFERWASNDKSRKKALVDLSRARTEHIQTLADLHLETHVRLQFVIEAWEQIVECRRILKWSYAYGFYMSDINKRKKNFFEYLQGEAESALERLHHGAEQEMVQYFDYKSVVSLKSFTDFRTKLVSLTAVTRNFFENLVKALENGLSEVESFID
ncbi:hypothetical protein ACJIZ3_008838 [Penstemon smallii]|uniref:RBR-type E3 ubiquitin transferase n=1 Tax=Penstemon smallii TaxID=265156 RepID=A0ABD3TBC5_9LAMI